MDWTRAVDIYCERTAAGLWAEPLNAVTNLAFLAVAAALWPRMRGHGAARLLCLALCAIGIGSGLFHVFAQPWAGLVDVSAIFAFVILYLQAAHREFWRLPPWSAAAMTLGSLFLLGVVAQVPPFRAALGSSAGYATLPVLILAHAAALLSRAPATARGLALGAGLLGLSIAAREADMPLCPDWPLGTHFLWHLLNAAMLGWMILVLRAHRLAGASGRV